LSSTKLALRGVDLNDLSDRHRAFIFEYVKDYDGTRAARAVGYKNPHVIAARLTDGKTYPKVARAIGAIQRKNLESNVDIKDKIIGILCRAAEANLTHYKNKNGMIVLEGLEDIPDEIAELTGPTKIIFKKNKSGDGEDEYVNETKEVHVGILDRQWAIEQLMKHLGMFAPEKVVHGFDWEALYQESIEDNDLEIIEGEIAKAALPEPKEEKPTKKKKKVLRKKK